MSPIFRHEFTFITLRSRLIFSYSWFPSSRRFPLLRSTRAYLTVSDAAPFAPCAICLPSLFSLVCAAAVISLFLILSKHKRIEKREANFLPSHFHYFVSSSPLRRFISSAFVSFFTSRLSRLSLCGWMNDSGRGLMRNFFFGLHKPKKRREDESTSNNKFIFNLSKGWQERFSLIKKRSFVLFHPTHARCV